jgi:hypothetical protein
MAMQQISDLTAHEMDVYAETQAWSLSKAHAERKSASSNQTLWDLKFPSKLIELPVRFNSMSRTLTHNYLDSSLQTFEWPNLEIGGLWRSLNGELERYDRTDWTKVEAFLLRHAEVESRPTVDLDLEVCVQTCFSCRSGALDHLVELPKILTDFTGLKTLALWLYDIANDKQTASLKAAICQDNPAVRIMGYN